MHRYDPSRQKLALGLAFLAGSVDATGFVIARGYFTSFMSGNTTRMGVELSVNPALALLPLALIASFLTGVIGGALARRRVAEGASKRMLLTVVAALLLLASTLLQTGADYGFLVLAAGAMGVANNVFSRDGEVTVGVTYMTGALVRFGQGIAARIAGQPLAGARGYGLLWLTLAVGALAGGALCMFDARLAGLAAGFLALVLCGAAYRIETRA